MVRANFYHHLVAGRLSLGLQYLTGTASNSRGAAAAAGVGERGFRQHPVCPTTLGYTSYLLATAYRGRFAEGLGAVLPCYWIMPASPRRYWRAARSARYSAWIGAYADAAFAQVVAEALALADRSARLGGDDETGR